MEIKLIVNGQSVVAKDPEKNLLKFLREDLGLIGAKDGCNVGQCGTCTVIVDGKAVKSCIKKMKQLEGAIVETVEGLADGENLHPIQIAFLKTQAFQCGFCTPGLIMAIKALLDKNPHPSDDEIKRAIRQNICRCTGYVQVLEAIHLAIDIMDGKASRQLHDGDGWVGESPISKGGIERVTGKALFTDDFALRNPLQGKLFFPEYPHAKLLSVDIEEASKQPGVVYIATHKDIPGNKFFSQDDMPQQFLAIDKVRFIGDPIAVVYAETEEQAYAAMEFIKVEYEVLPVVKTARQGYEDDSVRVHDEYPNNYSSTIVQRGNVERGFAKADVIVEDHVTTQTVDHAYMEPDVSLAEYDDKGRIVLYGTSQDPTKIGGDVAAALKLEADQFRNITRPNGGAFGGRENCSTHLFAALGTFITKRPVRVIFSREEVNRYTTKRHATEFTYKIGATKDGMLTAMQTFGLADTGAYSDLGDYLMSCASSMGSGPYEVPNVDFNSHTVFTNKVVAGCFRGYGSTQVAVAVETVLDQVAEKLGISPFEIRRMNGLDIGKMTPVGQVIEYSCGFQDALTLIEEAFKADGLPDPSGPGKKVGYGLAAGFKNMAYGNDFHDGAGAKVLLSKDGRIELYTGGVELGQGHDTVMCQMAAETIGVPYKDIYIGPVDDDVSPYTTGSTSASRMTYVGGNAVRTASIKFKNALLDYVSKKTDISEGLLDVDQDGVYDCRKEETFRMTFAEIGKMLEDNQETLVEEYYYVAGETHGPREDSNNISQEMLAHRMVNAYIFAAQVAVVEVDEASGKVDVLRVYAADDCGRVVHRNFADGQLYGSVVMGMGYALSEDFVVEEGYNKTKGFVRLGVPDVTQTPEISGFLVEDIHPFGPFNAKGLGEVALNPTAPAILNAIYNAVGVRVKSIPVKSKKLAEAIKGDKIYK